MKLLRLIWKIPRIYHSTTLYQAHSLSHPVLFEDLFEAINIHKEFRGEKEGPNSSITSLNKPIHVMDMTLTLISSIMMSIMHSKKNC
jgi:hypothetical protein